MALLVVWLTPLAAAETSFQFSFVPGATLRYVATQKTTVETGPKDRKSASTSTVRHVKQWKVLGVDAKKIAELEMTFVSISLEQTEPDGKLLAYDSTKAESASSPLGQQLGKLVGRPLVRVKVAPWGDVQDVVNLTDQTELVRGPPFLVVMPEKPFTTDQSWKRDFTVSLDPPIGKGEKFEAVQTMSLIKIEGDRLTIKTLTDLVEPPKDAATQAMVVPFCPAGSVTLDRKAGVMVEGQWSIDRLVKDFPVAGSAFHFHSEFTEKRED